ncbi:diguanylate cyclase [Erythrobacter insulae]|uniref:diguanylate cyclase n=1 Tax=Erythrobacter insulae TaxID=2584124 RepID=A0A547PAM5_9SPHN|nr:GGDEF domain-containing protein [Erythrobacter insulae]TRD11084.1 diguanylate cyclase [Erythrobacter insulae]
MNYHSNPEQLSGKNGKDAVLSPGDGQFPPTRQRQARRDLLERISVFATRHDLEVTSVNLAIICSALSGSNGELAEAFAAREMSGDPIDQRWLDTVMRLDPETNARMKELEKLVDKLEYSLIRFSQSARSAQSETNDHREALDEHIDAISRAGDRLQNQAEFERVIALSRSMLERIEQAEQAMERSQAESDQLRQNLAQARMEADVDHLTRLPNRRAFERRFKSANEEARSAEKPLCVAFCDVDNFKSINDKHGHDAGDRVLCAIAHTLSSNASDDCFVSRHGGEEFVLLLYGFDKDAAWRKLDGIRRAQAAKTLMNRETGKSFGKITFSAGLAEVTEDVDPRSALIRADAALYEAKETGRNKVIAV